MPITDADIEEYLRTRSDFELELFVYRTLRESGCAASHGGTYIDPLSGKARQYDVRALFEIYRGNASLPKCRVAMAIECKSLSPEAPLLVSQVPRAPQDSHHDLLHSWPRQKQGQTLAGVLKQEPSRLYQLDQRAGKRTAQVSRSNNGFKDDDRDPYEKWSQALASAADLVKAAAAAASDGQQALSLILPVLVVADGTLWVANYSEDGARVGVARAVDDVELFVDREYTWHTAADNYPAMIYRVYYLHIYTRTGFSHFVQQLSRDERLRHIMFEPALRKLLEK